MHVHVYVETSSKLKTVTKAVHDHGCEVKQLAPKVYEVKVHDPNGDAEDEVTEYMNEAGITAFVSYENPLDAGKPKAFDLLICGNLLSIVVTGGKNGSKGGNIESGLPRETCPSCGSPDCCHSCDQSQMENVGDDDDNPCDGEENDDVAGRLAYNGFVDAIESIALAHACAGIKVDDRKYIEGLNSALEAAGNNL